MAVAERDMNLATEMKRHNLAVAILSDPEAIEGLKRALEQEERGDFIPFSELRKKFGTKPRG